MMPSFASWLLVAAVAVVGVVRGQLTNCVSLNSGSDVKVAWRISGDSIAVQFSGISVVRPVRAPRARPCERAH